MNITDFDVLQWRLVSDMPFINLSHEYDEEVPQIIMCNRGPTISCMWVATRQQQIPQGWDNYNLGWLIKSCQQSARKRFRRNFTNDINQLGLKDLAYAVTMHWCSVPCVHNVCGFGPTQRRGWPKAKLARRNLSLTLKMKSILICIHRKSVHESPSPQGCIDRIDATASRATADELNGSQALRYSVGTDCDWKLLEALALQTFS